MQEKIKEMLLAKAEPLMVGKVPFCFVIPSAYIDVLAFDIEQALKQAYVMQALCAGPLALIEQMLNIETESGNAAINTDYITAQKHFENAEALQRVIKLIEEQKVQANGA